MRKLRVAPIRMPLRLVVLVIIVISALLIATAIMLSSRGRNNSVKVVKPYHSGQFVEDKQTAIQITKQACITKFGQGYIQPDQLFDAHLKNGNWYVDGWVPPPKPTVIVLGGGINAIIRQRDGRVLRISVAK